jgi:hypothetical protein
MKATALPRAAQPTRAGALVFHHSRSAFTVGILLLAVGAGFLLLPRPLAYALLAEGGPVELASLLFLAAAGLMALGRLARRQRGSWGAAAALLLVGALRELDFHNRFTSRAISQLRFYTSAEVPWIEKALVVPLLALLGYAALRVWRPTRVALRDGRGVDPAVVFGVGLWLLALGADRLVRVLVAELGRDALGGLAFTAFLFEETAELWAAALFFLAVASPWTGRAHRPAALERAGWHWTTPAARARLRLLHRFTGRRRTPG